VGLYEYPIDAASIPYDRLDEWRDDFYLPEPPDAHWRFFEDVRNVWFNAIRGAQGSELGEIALIKVKLYQEHTKVFTALRFIQQVAKHRKPVCGEKAVLINRLLGGDTHFPNSLRFSEWQKHPPMKMLALWGRNIIYTARVNKNWLYPLNSKSGGLRILNTVPASESMAYCAKIGRSFLYTPPAEWLDGAADTVIPSGLKADIESLADSQIAGLKDLAVKYQIIVPDEIYSLLRTYTLRHLDCAAREKICVEKKFRKRGPALLLGGNQCADFPRAMALVNRKLGGRSLGFNHGNDAFSNRDITFEMSIVNEFVTYTEGGAELLRGRDDSVYPPLSPNKPEISSLNTDKYLRLYERFCAKPPPETVKTVMVCGFPFDHGEVFTFGPPDQTFMWLELNTVEALVKSGFNTIYKAHPEACRAFPAEYFGGKVSVSAEPFEEVAERADAFVFTYSFTSVFPWALCSNKPAVLINNMKVHRYHTPEVMAELAKRCKIIEVSPDQRNRPVFNTEEMTEYLSRKPGPQDNTLIQKYMFPRPMKNEE
jgi:hypothetical protein